MQPVVKTALEAETSIQITFSDWLEMQPVVKTALEAETSIQITLYALKGAD
ncbi:hypothetical protein BCR33DRAFT_799662 [Rhizoclosmatium globosum]|uniref:Uncharacterized protein n=1 Tax=Rhizoclosmatium globosum TaxID=329046 RepID=A0A1Y2A431_9FUNG|nr:hypothetical protein BCR33DRAFT_799662 [Rhizoclosmatium globosum]|eukprot:ORY17047.1 hypothetical protein BCR33DRAFT_799662 [Rhizoclosmatium globosum]